MTKTILWDFDGVILDSMKIKGDGFITLFQHHDNKHLAQMEQFHYENGGVSRFEKIKYFYTEIIKEPVTEDKINELSEDFSSIIEKKLLETDNLISDSVDFIRRNYNRYNFHIVSGAEHKELNRLCAHFGLTQFFKSISGSPTKKDILVSNVIENYNYNKDEVLLIGDAMTDYNAAVFNRIKFFGYNNLSLEELGNYIHSFREFTLEC